METALQKGIHNLQRCVGDVGLGHPWIVMHVAPVLCSSRIVISIFINLSWEKEAYPYTSSQGQFWSSLDVWDVLEGIPGWEWGRESFSLQDVTGTSHSWGAGLLSLLVLSWERRGDRGKKKILLTLLLLNSLPPPMRSHKYQWIAWTTAHQTEQQSYQKLVLSKHH